MEVCAKYFPVIKPFKGWEIDHLFTPYMEINFRLSFKQLVSVNMLVWTRDLVKKSISFIRSDIFWLFKYGQKFCKF